MLESPRAGFGCSTFATSQQPSVRGSSVLPRRHFKREAERRIVLARMVVVPGELRDAEIVRPRLLTFVDARIEIDEVPAGLAGRLQDHLDIALAVEATGVADIGVI